MPEYGGILEPAEMYRCEAVSLERGARGCYASSKREARSARRKNTSTTEASHMQHKGSEYSRSLLLSSPSRLLLLRRLSAILAVPHVAPAWTSWSQLLLHRAKACMQTRMYVTGDDVNRFLDDNHVSRLSHASGVILSKKLKKRKGAFAIVR